MTEKEKKKSNSNERGVHGIPDSFSSIHIIPLNHPDAETAARLYTDVFLQDEPTSFRHALDPIRFLPYARYYIQWLITKNISYLARDSTTGEITGFIFCLDLADDPDQEGPMMQEFLQHFRQAITMIDELEARYFNPELPIRGTGLHIFQIGVKRKNRGRGIAQAMISRAIRNAEERGFRQAIADCTNPVSRQTFERCGFCECGFSSYESFCMDGVFFFAGLDSGISLMIKNLAP